MSAFGDQLHGIFVRWPWSAMWITGIVIAVLICKLMGLP